MKYLSLLLVLAFSYTALAGPTAVNCNETQRTSLRSALQKAEIRIGSDYRSLAVRWLKPGIASSCVKLVGVFGATIPGQQMREFEISYNTDQVLKVTLVSTGVEGGNRNYIVIKAR